MTIKEIRAMTGLSQAAFADKHGIPKRSIENWESGVRACPEYVIKLLEKAEKDQMKMRTKIAEIMDKTFYDCYGLRIDKFDRYSVGEACDNSHMLYQDAMYDEDGNLVYPMGDGVYAGFYDAGEMSGTSAIKIDALAEFEKRLKAVKAYDGDYMYLIAGKIDSYGDDNYEVIIKDAVVLEAF